MWANPFGASWSMHQADYQNVPHENVDWAALAKQWISQRETHGPSHLVMPPPADGPSVAPPPPPPPPPPEPEPDTAQPKHAADENSMDIASDEEENGNSVVARVSEPEAVGQQFSSSGQAPWIPQQQSWWPPRQSEDLWMGPQIGSNKEGFSGDMQGFQPMSSFPPGGDIYFNQVMPRDGVPHFHPSILLMGQDSNNKDQYWDEHTGGGDSDSSQPPLLAEPPLRSHHQMHHHHHHHQHGSSGHHGQNLSVAYSNGYLNGYGEDNGYGFDQRSGSPTKMNGANGLPPLSNTGGPGQLSQSSPTAEQIQQQMQHPPPMPHLTQAFNHPPTDTSTMLPPLSSQQQLPSSTATITTTSNSSTSLMNHISSGVGSGKPISTGSNSKYQGIRGQVGSRTKQSSPLKEMK
uniref:Uncharacterized protein n=1 Tax=Arion vulgaris TaxID=1028688 RepID=A0A0B7AZ84_9EUPU